MRVQIEALNISFSLPWKNFAVGFVLVKPPVNTPTECSLEVLDSLTCHRIDHLLVKAWIRFGRAKSGRDQETWIVKIDGFVEDLVLAVVIDHRDALADGAGAKRFVLHVQRHLIPEKLSVARVEGVAFERARIGRRNLDYVRQYAGVGLSGGFGFVIGWGRGHCCVGGVCHLLFPEEKEVRFGSPG